MNYFKKEKKSEFILVKFAFASAFFVVAGGVFVQQLTNKYYENPSVVIVKENNADDNKKLFEPGEHVISMQVSRPKINITTQYYVQRGYKLISFDVDSTGAILTYVNTDSVICEATGIDDNGEYTYTEFGTSQEKKEIKDDIDGYDIYAPYEHIMLVPILDPRYESVQYSDVDGYELVDVIYYDKIKSSKYSLPEVKLKGSWALYTNNVTVKRQISDDEFIEFGEPVE